MTPANNTGSSSADFLDWRARAQSFSAIGTLRPADPHTLGVRLKVGGSVGWEDVSNTI